MKTARRCSAGPFFAKTFSRASCPIFACSVFTSTGGFVCRPSVNTSAAPRSNCSFHAVIWPGCTSKRLAYSASVPALRTAATATLALNSGERSCETVSTSGTPPVMGEFSSGEPSCLPIPPVQILGATSIRDREIASRAYRLQHNDKVEAPTIALYTWVGADPGTGH